MPNDSSVMVTFCTYLCASVHLCVCVWEKGSLRFPLNKDDIGDDDDDDGDLQPQPRLCS